MAALEADDAGAALDHVITQFNSYEDYLDSQITTQDLFYLEASAYAVPAYGKSVVGHVAVAVLFLGY